MKDWNVRPSDEELLSGCSLRPGSAPLGQGLCQWCDASLPKGRRKWCSDTCSRAFLTNHWQSFARFELPRRRGHAECRRCGRSPAGLRLAALLLDGLAWHDVPYGDQRAVKLEINHVRPVRGARLAGCQHHLEGLEILCHECHAGVTRLQIVAARASGGSRTIACWESQHAECWSDDGAACYCWCHHGGEPDPEQQELVAQKDGSAL